MFFDKIIDGFVTGHSLVRVYISNMPGILLYFHSDMQKKAFIGLHLDEAPPEYIQSKFGGEKGLIEEAEKLFNEERFEKNLEKIIRAMADQSVTIKKTRLHIVKKVFIL